jgi:hypothetical protein
MPLRGVRQGVSIGKTSVVVVSGIGIAALAVLEAPSDRIVVVAPNDRNASLPQQLHGPVRVRTEGPEISQTEHGLGTTIDRVIE